METRKVQVTGGSTYTVSLPKEWATVNNVSSGSVVEFHAEQDLLLLAPKYDEERVEGTLNVDGLDNPHELARAVMTMYVSGFGVIQLEAARIKTEQRRIIRDATQGLVGLEVIEETSDRIVLQDLLDSSELSIHNAITRTRLVSLTMLSDAVEALIEDDDDLAANVIQRDDDVDRLWYMIWRVFRTVLRNPTAADEIGFPRETVFEYQSSVRQLERIADHAIKIAGLSMEIGKISGDTADLLRELESEAMTVPEMAMDALLTDDSEVAVEQANDAQSRIPTVDETARDIDSKVRKADPESAQILGRVVDSLSRTADYGGNIAESARQKAAPCPQS